MRDCARYCWHTDHNRNSNDKTRELFHKRGLCASRCYKRLYMNSLKSWLSEVGILLSLFSVRTGRPRQSQVSCPRLPDSEVVEPGVTGVTRSDLCSQPLTTAPVPWLRTNHCRISFCCGGRHADHVPVKPSSLGSGTPQYSSFPFLSPDAP